VLPRLGGYSYEEEMDELDDGTKISRLVRVRKEEYEKVNVSEEDSDEELEEKEIQLQARIDDANCIYQ